MNNSIVIVQMLESGHDSNGNKKACHLVYNMQGDLIELHMYNFEYPKKIHENHSAVVNLPPMTVARKEFKEWIKSAKLSNHVTFYN